MTVSAESMPGVYNIINTIDSKKYIGASNNCLRRLKKHLHDLRKGIHHNRHLQHAFDKYGEGNFIFQVKEYCEVADIFVREGEHIKANIGDIYNGSQASYLWYKGIESDNGIFPPLEYPAIPKETTKYTSEVKCTYCGATSWTTNKNIKKENNLFCGEPCRDLHNSFGNNIYEEVMGLNRLQAREEYAKILHLYYLVRAVKFRNKGIGTNRTGSKMSEETKNKIGKS